MDVPPKLAADARNVPLPQFIQRSNFSDVGFHCIGIVKMEVSFCEFKMAERTFFFCEFKIGERTFAEFNFEQVDLYTASKLLKIKFSLL